MGDCSCESNLIVKLILIVLSFPNITDLILSILSYHEDCKTYYIIRFVTQGINLLFLVLLAIFLTLFGEKNNPIANGIIYSFVWIYCLIAILPMEITSLVYFIRNYGLLFNLGKIGFFIHLGFYGLIILSYASFVIYGYCNIPRDDKKDNNYNSLE